MTDGNKSPTVPDPSNEDSAETFQPQFALVWEWVEGWLGKYIRRKIQPEAGKGLCWDPEWWHFPEVVARFLALHAAWEEARLSKSAAAMSTWFLSHFEPHWRLITDSDSGPMSGAGAGEQFEGHLALVTEPVPEDIKREYDISDLPAFQALDPLYETVWDWVERWFVKVVRRKINPDPGRGLSWDPRWWNYPEVVLRFQALHLAWEEARVSETASAMSTWWVSHLEGHLRVIFDSDTGPMSLAGQEFDGHEDLPLGVVPADVRRQLTPAA
ncbi:DUF4913 domain-containing protein [Nocardia niigatensis]